MKLFVEFYLETISMLFLASNETVDDVIMNFVAMICVSEIDKMYFTSIRSHLKEELEE